LKKKKKKTGKYTQKGKGIHKKFLHSLSDREWAATRQGRHENHTVLAKNYNRTAEKGSSMREREETTKEDQKSGARLEM